MPPNGVEVRGLRVLRVYEDRPVAWWRVVLGAVLPVNDRWSVLTVSNGQGEVVARRGFNRDRKAEDARRRFVGVVAEMSDADYGTADWQAVLDSA